MDWQALRLSLLLAAATTVLLLPVSVFAGRWMAESRFRGKILVEAAIATPLVLPPTVIGYYLLVGMGANSPLGAWFSHVFGQTLVFSFSGLLVASLLVNLPFAIQPAQRAFEAIPQDVRDAAQCCGMSFWRGLWSVDLPLAWPGILTGLTLSFAHTLGEFGVVLMVGGAIPGETKTVSIAIYDQVQSLNFHGAGSMSLLLLLISLGLLVFVNLLGRYAGRLHAYRNL
jgi:molybdate transport system permease protein